jgi:hypothetical protein
MMTTVVRSLRGDGPFDDEAGERAAALERVNELLNEAQQIEATRDTEWVADLASRRIVRRAVHRGRAS